MLRGESEARMKERKAKNDGGEDDLLTVMLRIRDEGDFEIPLNTTNIKAIILVRSNVIQYNVNLDSPFGTIIRCRRARMHMPDN